MTRRGSRRRAGRLLPLTGGLVALTALASCGGSSPLSGLGSALDAGPSRGSTDYVSPSGSDASDVAGAVVAAADGGTAAAPPGYRVTSDGGVTVFAEEPHNGVTRGWGFYAVRPGSASTLVVEVPHPRSDRWTEVLGADLFSAAGARALLVAGAHRTAADGAADVAHAPDSVFARVDAALVRPGWTVVQLHGFAEARHDIDAEAVVSSSAPTPTPEVLAVAEALTRRGIAACVYDGVECQGLGGTQNVQGAHAREVGAPFVHLELADTVRDDPARRALAVAAVAEALGPG